MFKDKIGLKRFDEIIYLKSLTTLSNESFSGCTSLEKLTIPETVTSLGDNCFNGCSDKLKLTFKSINPPTITSETFANFNGVIYVPKEQLENYKTASVWSTISNDIYPIGYGTFKDVRVVKTVLENVDVKGYPLLPSELKSIKTLNGAFNKEIAGYFGHGVYVTEFNEFQYFTGITELKEKEFYGCSSMTSIVLPDTITSFNASCFSNCSVLKTVNIPRGVTTIPNHCFSHTGLESIDLHDNIIYLGDYSFYSTKVETIEVPDSVKVLGKYCFGYSKLLKSIKLPNELISIPEFCFYECDVLESIVWPNSLKTIEERAFNNCRGLKSIVLPNGLTNIGKSAFYNTGLETAVVPETVTDIEEGCFYCPSTKVLIILKAKTPPNINPAAGNNGSFVGVNYKFYVPDSSLNDYHNHDKWKYLKSKVFPLSQLPSEYEYLNV